MTAWELIDTQQALAACATALGRETEIYLDTEFESSRDGTTLSLAQIRAGDAIWLLDAQRVSLAPLRPALVRPEVTWVVHAGREDVPLMLRALSASQAPRVYDTQIAYALIGPEFSVSLAYLEYRLLGVRAVKEHQADDWKRRPLSRSQLEYAARDVEHLPALRARLDVDLARLGRSELVITASREALDPPPSTPSRLTLQDFRHAWQLDAPRQAALLALVELLNGLTSAERRDAPEPKTLLAVASRLPESVGDIARIKGVGRRFVEAHGARALAAIGRAVADAPDVSPLEPPPYATWQQVAVHGWVEQLRATLSRRLEIAPELLFSSRQAERLARAVASGVAADDLAAELDGWRRTELRAPLAAYVRDVPPPLDQDGVRP